MPPPITTRRGTSLIELMLVIVLASLALGAVAVLIQGVWRANHAVRDHREETSAIQRLAKQFRDDVHAAPSVDLEPEEFIAHGFSEDQPMSVYEIKEKSVHRSVVQLGQLLQRDSFDLPTGSKVTIEAPSGEDEPQIASLVITYPLGTMQPEFADRRTLRIEAAVGISPTRTRKE